MADRSQEEGQEARAGGGSARIVVVVLGAIIVLTIFSVWLPSMSLKQEFQEEVEIEVSDPVPGFGGRAAIAVLPFTSGDPSLANLADGLSTEIIARLQTDRLIPVIGRGSTFTYRDPDIDARDVAWELGAGYVLKGNVRGHAGDFEVAAQLFDADGVRAWGETYDGTPANVFDIRDEIAARIAQSLETMPGETRLAAPASRDAWNLLLEAQARFPILSLDESTEVERLVGSALELDPGLGAAHVMLGEIYFVRATELGAPFDESIGLATEHGRRAKQLAPARAAICSCLGTYLAAAGHLEEALGEHVQAIELAPSSGLAHGRYAWALISAGRYEQGLEHARIAMRLSPRDPGLYRLKTSEGIALMMLGELDGALHALRQASSMSASWRNVSHIYLVAAEYTAGRLGAARKEARRVSRSIPALPLSRLMPPLGVERPMTSKLREALRDEFPGDIDSASELQVFAYVLRRAGWSGLIEPGETEG